MDCSTPAFPVLHHLPELAQTHVQWVSDAIQPSHPLSSASPPAFNPSQHQGLFQWVSSSHQVAKYWTFSFSLIYHSLLQQTTFCQNSPLWLVCLRWPCNVQLIISLSYTELWSMWSVWLVFCDCDNIFYTYRIKSGASVPSLCYVFFRALLLDRFPWKWTLRKRVDCRSFTGEAVGKYTY